MTAFVPLFVLNLTGWSRTDDGTVSPWKDVVPALAHYALLALVMVIYALRKGLSPRQTFGPWPPGRGWRRFAWLGVPMVGLALVTIYVVWVPLSLRWRDEVQFWMFEDMPVIYSAGPPYPLAANIAGITMITLFGPVIEEWFFRGLLLRRLVHKWGSTAGVVLSSLVFALLHTDLLGAFLFGVVMCALYARYRSLWPATIVHMATNTLAAALLVLGEHGAIGSIVSVETLRAMWWLPLMGAALALPWVVRSRGWWTPMRTWQFEMPSSTAGPVAPSATNTAAPAEYPANVPSEPR